MYLFNLLPPLLHAVLSRPRRLPTEIMSQREHSITIILVWNDSGVPVVPISRDARVTLSVDTSDSRLAAAPKLPEQHIPFRFMAIALGL